MPMLTVNALLPGLNNPLSYVAFGGVVALCLSGFCRTAKSANRIEFIGLCACAMGSMTIVKTLALALRH
jgi:hypothetical protein